MLSVPMLQNQHFTLTITVTKAASQFWQILSEILTEAHLGYSRQFYIAQAKVSGMFHSISEQTQSVDFLCAMHRNLSASSPSTVQHV